MNSTIKELILSKVINFEEFWLSFISAVFWLIYTLVSSSLFWFFWLSILLFFSSLILFFSLQSHPGSSSCLLPPEPKSWVFLRGSHLLPFFSGCGEPVLRCSWGGNIQWACLLVSQHDTGWCVSPISLVREMQAQVCRASDVRDYLGSHFTDELRGGDGMKTQAG